MKNEPQHPITRVLTGLLEQICKRPGDLRVSEELEGTRLAITVQPHMADFPLLVGKDGRQVKALKCLAEQMGYNSSLEVTVELEESMIGERDKGSRTPAQNKDFTLDTFYDVLVPIVYRTFGKGVEIETLHEDNEFVAYIDVPTSETTTIIAIADLLYCVCKKNGRKCDVKTMAARKSAEVQ